MTDEYDVVRTSTNNLDFIHLVNALDNELWNELNEDQATYDQYNKVQDLPTAIIIYADGKPAAIGCFKKYNNDTVEIKRMFVEKNYRGKGLSKIVLNELEKWAVEQGYKYSILETSIHFNTAQTLYKKAGYYKIPNYDQYKDLEESVCMKKEIYKP